MTADLERDGDSDTMPATFGYLGAIFLGPVIPLAVYVLRSRRSTFMPRFPIRRARPPCARCFAFSKRKAT